jgi:hypothetical protein
MNKLLHHFIGLVPGLIVAYSYGRMTGDMKNSLTVIALLVGMWAGLTYGRIVRRTAKAGDKAID